MMRKLLKGFVVIIMSLAIYLIPARGITADPINMLFLDPLTGPASDVGYRVQLGIKFAVEEVNKSGGILGSPIKMFYEDSQNKPDISARKASRYIEEQKIKFIVQGNGTHVAKSLAQIAQKNNIIHLNYGAAGDDLTGKDFIPNTFRVALTSSQQSSAIASFFAKLPYKKYYLINQDYAFGHDVAKSFKNAMQRFNPKWELVGEDYHPLGAKDLAPYITKINASGAEVMITGDYGTDLQVLIKQAKALEMKAKIGGYYLVDPLLLRTIGDPAIGSITAEIYMLTEDTPQNKAFIERWKARKMDPEHVYPAWLIGKSYQAFMFMIEAIKKAKSFNAGEVIKAWEGLSYDALTGRMTMRPCDHQVITPISIATIERGSGEYYDFPFVGKPTQIPGEVAAIPPDQTGNPRCVK